MTNNKGYQFRSLSPSSSDIGSPLSYLLKKPVLHGKLMKVYLRLNWETDNSSSLIESLKIPSPTMNDFLYNAMFQMFFDNVGPMYPLIFSQEYSKRMAELTRYVPIISQSIQNIVTRGVSGSEDDQQYDKQQQQLSETNQICLATIQAMTSKARILQSIPEKQKYQGKNGTTETDLIVALYYYFKNTISFPKCVKIGAEAINNTSTEPATNISKNNEDTLQTPYDSIVNIWTTYQE
ncbi:hypothetical protein BDA99DRAFT_499910 [Phascolomyces articulosus]|uniref:Uncharacterized protein n=1 Tax=Phascolomyces articulosus TaxID=60185 RepID=A0AAD5KK26_9FUNG|nr:hypothetical protein BDA99DRAFT_499910 [Phascolomyces articulosus]